MKLWHTAQELADLNLDGFPGTKRGVHKLIEREGWAETPLCRRRRGSLGGGGFEYHIDLLPLPQKLAYAARFISLEPDDFLCETNEGLTTRERTARDARLIVLKVAERFHRQSGMGQAVTAFSGAIGAGALTSALISGAATVAGAYADNLLVSALTPSRNTSVNGPRIGDLRLQTSTEGAPIPDAFGRLRLAGQVIWATRLRMEVATSSQKAGGKGVGGGQKVTTMTYLYYGNFAIAICEGPIIGIGRVWADGKLLDRSTLPPRKAWRNAAPCAAATIRQGRNNLQATASVAASTDRVICPGTAVPNRASTWAPAAAVLSAVPGCPAAGSQVIRPRQG